MLYEKNLSEPWFSLIKFKIKTVEGRLNKGDFSKMNIGDEITFTNNELGIPRQFTVKIVDIKNYDTFRSYLRAEGLSRCLPTIEDLENGVSVYYKYYTPSDEATYGIKAFKFD
jgi:ASC-1-like (ASCH) protein